jgi:hypothetical protein
MNMLPKKVFESLRLAILISIATMISILYVNQNVFFVYCNFIQYKLAKLHYELSSDNEVRHDSISYMSKTISSGKEAGYVCENESLAGDSAYQEVITRRQKKIGSSPSYIILNCIQLPTGEIFLSMSTGVTRFYIVLKKTSEKKHKYHHILDVKGETTG